MFHDRTQRHFITQEAYIGFDCVTVKLLSTKTKINDNLKYQYSMLSYNDKRNVFPSHY